MEEIRKLTGFPILGEEDVRLEEGFPLLEFVPVKTDEQALDDLNS